ncbi:MAG: hypothetical protein PHP54_00865 [Clostridia bacterium]|nr:hypothetical protein [Clostridia bacterium]
MEKGKILNFKKLSKKMNRKKGSAVAETILLIGISLVIIIVVFFPQLKSMMNDALVTISTWFKTTLSNIGI